jgi:hypothetical protein
LLLITPEGSFLPSILRQVLCPVKEVCKVCIRPPFLVQVKSGLPPFSLQLLDSNESSKNLPALGNMHDETFKEALLGLDPDDIGC